MSKLPDTWQEVKLKDIATFSQGLQVAVEEQVSTPIDNYVRFIRIVDYTQKNEDIRFVENKGQRYFASKSDIVMVRYGTPGLVGRGIEGIIANNLFKINLDQKIANNDFFEHLLKSSFVQNKLQSGSASTTMPAINFSTLNTVVIPLPPIEEQKKIADILSTVDKKIAFVEENINATEELKKGLMQKLLTEGIGHTEFKDSELGRIPESWEVIPFIELADKNIKHSFTGGPFGSDLKSEHYTDIGVRVIQLQNIGDGYFINNDFVYVSEEKAELLKSCQIYPNDIILAKMAEPVARACLIPDFESKYVMCSDGIRLKVDNSKFNTEFIFYSINYDNFRKIAVARSNGTTRLRIGLSALKSIPILIPPLEEQKQIAEILSTVDKKLENLKEKKQSFEELKKGLMQKLLTGEVRV